MKNNMLLVFKFYLFITAISLTTNVYAENFKNIYVFKNKTDSIKIDKDSLRTYRGMVTAQVQWAHPSLGMNKYAFISYMCGSGEIWIHNFTDTPEPAFSKGNPEAPWLEKDSSIRKGLATVTSPACKLEPNGESIQLIIAMSDSSVQTFDPTQTKLKHGLVKTWVYSYPLNTERNTNTEGTPKAAEVFSENNQYKIFSETINCFEGSVLLSQISNIKNGEVVSSNSYDKPPFTPPPGSMAHRKITYLCGMTNE